jgi:8-hydroxy-5-deazaflavin:NADPH oxidoreductase
MGMRIAVIGTGHIGGSLGTTWRTAGHEVAFGSRTPSADGPAGVPVQSVADAITGADVVLLAVPGAAVADVLTEHGQAMAGKVVIDASNRMSADQPNSRAQVAASAPAAKYARAFNTLGWENFVDPPAGAALFFAADPGARAATEELISATGLEPVFVGNADAAATVDGVLRLWFALVQQSGGNRKLAFRVVR